VGAYNAPRPHQALGMAVPVERFTLAGPSPTPVTAALVGQRRSEHGHDGIADERLHRAPVPLDLGPEPGMVGPDPGPDVFGVGVVR
jgi:hypothetical protein